MKMALLLFGLVIAMIGSACESTHVNTVGSGSPQPFDESKVVKVKVTQKGEIYLDERLVTLDEVKAAFAKLKQENGVVWYHRENPAGEPTIEAMSVITAIMDNKLPVKLSSKPDFSDAIGDDGKPVSSR